MMRFVTAAMILSAAPALAQECMTMEQVTGKYPPNVYKLSKQRPIYSERWVVVGREILIVNPQTGHFISIHVTDDCVRVEEHQGNPHVAGEPA